MGLYNFKKRFVPYILDGTKTHTIRARRRVPDKIGNPFHGYTGLRTKSAQKLIESRITQIQSIYVSILREVFVDRILLSTKDCNTLAWRDGFRSDKIIFAFEEMMTFWEGRLPFEGDMIHWSFGQASFVAIPPEPIITMPKRIDLPGQQRLF
jgi:hypothetical protein